MAENTGKQAREKMIVWSVASGIVMAALAFAFLVLMAIGAGYQQYKVYASRKTGEAELARAESEKRILVETARAEVEAAELRAEAISIVGKSAQEYPEYRLQEFMGAYAEALNNGSVQKIIYVPTEAGIPIMEAGAR